MKAQYAAKTPEEVKKSLDAMTILQDYEWTVRADTADGVVDKPPRTRLLSRGKKTYHEKLEPDGWIGRGGQSQLGPDLGGAGERRAEKEKY